MTDGFCVVVKDAKGTRYVGPFTTAEAAAYIAALPKGATGEVRSVSEAVPFTQLTPPKP